MTTNMQIQARLASLGFGPGPVDGILGPKTRTAITAFQQARDLEIKWPGTIGAKTLAALFDPAWQGTAVSRSSPAPQPMSITPPWFEEGRRRMGLHEVRDRYVLMAWLRSDGKTLGDPAKLPWCGDFVQTCIALTLPHEPMVVNPYLARNWAKFGTELKSPALGAILVFWRGSRTGTSGHVGLYAGERQSDGALRVLGGNQSNSISEAWLDRSRLLGVRWPETYDMPGTGRVYLTASGALSTNEA